MELHENIRRDRKLAEAFRDSYQRGYDAESAGQFLAVDIRPLLKKGRVISASRVLEAAERLDVPHDREFGPWPKFVKRGVKSLMIHLERAERAA